jgi:myb proto-oncogene protein
MKFSRRHFTQDDDNLILTGIQLYGKNNWKLVAELLTNRSSHQVRERYKNYLNPEINKEPWTIEEDLLLISLVKQYGRKWSMFSKELQGRTQTAIKNRWNTFMWKKKKKVQSDQSRQEISLFDYPDFDFESFVFCFD